MKTLFNFALIILLCGGTLNAQDNSITISQLGNENNLQAEQIGSMNEIYGLQEGTDNEAFIKQLDGSSFNFSQVNQIGSNFANIEQLGNNNKVFLNQLPGDIESELNFPPGNGNPPPFQTYENDGISTSIAQVIQDGSYNMVAMNQSGSHTGEISQKGVSNNVQLTQGGVYSGISFNPPGNGNPNPPPFSGSLLNSSIAKVYQDGFENLSLLNQIGSNEAYINQYGDGNRAEILQFGDMNAAIINQIGHGHAAFIEQIGYGNSINITQQ